MEFSVIGKSVPRVDALEKVTGKAIFYTDITLPGMLHAKILRSPYPHAKILSIDTSKAEKLPGVRSVLTGKDVGQEKFGLTVWDETILARDVVRYVGEEVAAVAADTIDIAEEALELIEVKYEELPAIFDVEESMSTKPLVIIHPDLLNYPQGARFGGARFVLDRPNVAHHVTISRGDVEKGFEESDVVMENRFSTARIPHCTLEPASTTVKPEFDGGVTIWACSQLLSRVQADLSRVFNIPPSKVRIIQTYMGGGFGRVGIRASVAVLALALKTGRPVKLLYTREEVFYDHARNPMIIYIKDGVKKDGTLVAREMKAILGGSGYENWQGLITRNIMFPTVGTYRTPNISFDSYAVYANNPRVHGMRGLGSVEICWAIESQMDILAEKLDIDPAELRMKNILKEGEPNAMNEIVHSIGARECLDKLVERMKQKGLKEKSKKEGAWRRGVGIAIGNKYSLAPTASHAMVKIREDGTVDLFHSAEEIGQGVNTVMAQIVAEEFGVPVDKVRVRLGDTLYSPYDHGTASSRVTYNLGNAVIRACQDAKKKVFEIAARRLNVSPDNLDTKGGEVFAKGMPEQKIRLTELFIGFGLDRPGGYGSYIREGEIVGHGAWFQPGAREDPETGQISAEASARGERAAAFFAHTAKGAEVLVNTETGEVKVTWCASVNDMGNPLNPKICEQQAEGGLAMAIGDGLYEESKSEKGRVLNPNFVDYRIPTVKEMPPLGNMETYIAPAPHKDGPYGAKGFAEGVMIGLEPAIGNAVYDAVGVRIKDLPITPEKILRALREKGK